MRGHCRQPETFGKQAWESGEEAAQAQNPPKRHCTRVCQLSFPGSEAKGYICG